MDLKPLPRSNGVTNALNGVGTALSDTPLPTAPNSPRIPPIRQNSGSNTPRIRPTTLDIPGLTKSKVSPDGRIAQRDVGAKLVIVMVGLPARGKSYITKKLARYLNWLQHDTRIFNVGERRRVAAGGPNQIQQTHSHTDGRPQDTVHRLSVTTTQPSGIVDQKQQLDPPQIAARILINGETPVDSPSTPYNSTPTENGHGSEGAAHDDHSHLEAQFPHLERATTPDELPDVDAMEQSASFFDPQNKKAALIREQVAMETLHELLDYILEDGGSIGIFDATNSTLERRKIIMKTIRERAGPELNVLFLESRCLDENLLESNMRLKLSGPDYKDKDPVAALIDFKKRVAIYEKNYVPLGEYERQNKMPFIQMIDVGEEFISYKIKGFIAAQVHFYLLNFNLAPRQIWITRHGQSMDNVCGKIGGNSDLSDAGRLYAKDLTRFIDHMRKEWDVRQLDKISRSHFPPQPGDTTPPNPQYAPEGQETQQISFCVWTSMLKRSIQTSQYFDDDEYEMKQMKMLDELNAGDMEGMTYDEIQTGHAEEYALRKQDKLHYRYPGAGGEGYLDVINRLRPVIVELERMTDHVLLVGHRSVARVLLAYFKGLSREDVADLDVPLGTLYMLEPKPYGVDFKAYEYKPDQQWFVEDPTYTLKKAKTENA
ncbi:6-phosphofructo-2-kinase/fructose-2,6-biphosphatase [Cryomyces antarcticus]